jgi:hypothetical protein
VELEGVKFCEKGTREDRSRSGWDAVSTIMVFPSQLHQARALRPFSHIITKQALNGCNELNWPEAPFALLGKLVADRHSVYMELRF